MKRYELQMSLQFSIEDIINTLVVNLCHLSSEEEMEVDDPQTANQAEEERDSDIEVLACFRERPQLLPPSSRWKVHDHRYTWCFR